METTVSDQTSRWGNPPVLFVPSRLCYMKSKVQDASLARNDQRSVVAGLALFWFWLFPA